MHMLYTTVHTLFTVKNTLKRLQDIILGAISGVDKNLSIILGVKVGKSVILW